MAQFTGATIWKPVAQMRHQAKMDSAVANVAIMFVPTTTSQVTV